MGNEEVRSEKCGPERLGLRGGCSLKGDKEKRRRREEEAENWVP
jgi:hypothetical protein